MKNSRLRPIILAGGSGKRLWPLSTRERPKQFIPLFAEYSLFDLTLQRLNKESIFKKPIVVTSVDYKKYIEESIEVLSHYRNKSDRLIALSKYIVDRSL